MKNLLRTSLVAASLISAGSASSQPITAERTITSTRQAQQVRKEWDEEDTNFQHKNFRNELREYRQKATRKKRSKGE